MNFKVLISATGAILDSHGPLYVILPGSVGMVASLIFFSLSQGMCLRSPRFARAMLTTSRFLSDFPVFRHLGWYLCFYALHTTGSSCRSLVQHSSCLRNRSGMYSRWPWGSDISFGNSICNPSGWLCLVDPDHCTLVCNTLLCGMSHSQNKTSAQEDWRYTGSEIPPRHELRISIFRGFPCWICRICSHYIYHLLRPSCGV